MTQRKVTLVVPDGYASGEEFAKDCGFEIAKSPMEQLPWDAYANRYYEPVELRAAKIYELMDYDLPGMRPAWAPHGNSNKQDEARNRARKLLRDAGHKPNIEGRVSQPDKDKWTV